MILQQRQINSYTREGWKYWNEEWGTEETAFYHPGDFILHFASVRNRAHLKELMGKYAQQVLYSE